MYTDWKLSTFDNSVAFHCGKIGCNGHRPAQILPSPAAASPSTGGRRTSGAAAATGLATISTGLQ